MPATNSEIKWVIEEDDVRPVTWSELDRLRKDCDRLLAIFAEYVADVASGDRKTNPTKYMQNVTNAVSYGINVVVQPIKETTTKEEKHFLNVLFSSIFRKATRIAYPTVLLKKISEGLTGYKDETESLYRKDENNNLINFGIPIRYNEETTITVNAVRRCISQLNKCMEIEITRTANFGKWEQELRQMFPNLHDDDMMLATIDPSTRISLSESEDHSSPEY